MKEKIEQIVSELKDRISGKYSIKEMRVFGSSARGDSKPESDIAVQALLVSRKVSFSKHGQVKAYFNREMIKTGIFPYGFSADCLLYCGQLMGGRRYAQA